MATQSLAIKYRPKKFDEVVEQSATKVILKQQLESGEIMNAYLFCGGAGTGKTTTARIFANEVNKGKGSPIEIDAASNNSVDDVRDIIQQAKTVSLESEYKIFILDEVHALSGQAWQAMLKILEEPPATAIFIMCTTDPQKIPRTILSRVQRYDFHRISIDGIVENLSYILKEETCEMVTKDNLRALEFIAKQAQGGMRDAITMLDKCLSYSYTVIISNVIQALGLFTYDILIKFVGSYLKDDWRTEISLINDIFLSGADLKQFVKELINFTVDMCKFTCGVDTKYLNCPTTDEILDLFQNCKQNNGQKLLSSLIKLQNDIKWDTNPKSRIEAWCITKE